ncbi:hypothetical protein [Burkholderia cenocepacia]|uniref:hypothetical protein n=1 Tax=Burkholderia cenocepacia TaxID=95486 RepID=UPI0024B6C93D|nr:hypothetical protein [Burkholderia cenocepacia]MDI9684319.1 hypothetical protein [Burkholderia cenocepacia]
MTVASDVQDVTYVPDGATVVFSIPFYFLRNGDVRADRVSVGGVVTPLIFGTDFSLTGAGNPNGGVLTTFDVLTAGGALHIYRDVPATQETQYQQNDPFPAKTTERALDKLTMLVQRAFGLISTGIRYPFVEFGMNAVLPLAAVRARKALVFKSTGEVGVSQQDWKEPQTILDEAKATAEAIAAGIAPGSGTGTFIQDGAGAVVRTFQSKMREQVSIQDFGARSVPGYDNSVALQLAALHGGRIYVPAGTYEYSTAPSSADVPVFLHGDGPAKSQLIQTTTGANGWNHGQVERPAYGATFQAENISFRCRGKGGIALNVKLNPVSGQFVMEDVQISGEVTDAGDGWHDPVSALGCSLTDWTNVIMIGPIGENLSNVGNGATFGTYERDDITNPGSYVYNIRGGASNYYRAGFVFNSPTYSGVEGVTMTEVNCNGCINFVVQNNDIYPTNHYRPPQYMFDECQFEGFGSMFRFSGASYVWITDSLCYIDAPNSRVPSDFSPQDTVYFHNSYGIKIEGNQFIAYPGSVIQYFVHFAAGDEGCSYARLRDNAFLCNGTCDGAVRAGTGSVSIREYSSDKYIWPAGNPPVFVDDTFPGQSGNFSKTSIAQKFATCDDFGNISYSFTMTDTTDASGVITVTLPAGMYRQVTNVIATNGDSNASSASCEVIWSTVTSSQFQVKFNGLSAPTAVRCNLTVSGF